MAFSAVAAACGGGDAAEETRAPLVAEAPPPDAPPAANDPVVRVEYRPYPVEGRTAEELRASIDARSPRDENGRGDAKTEWSLGWGFDAVSDDAGCRATRVRATLDVTIHHPAWTPPSDAAPDLVARWQIYDAAILAHERNHQAHAERAARRALDEIAALGGQPTCDELRAAADAVGAAAVARGRDADRDYDIETDNGRREGIRL